MNANMPVKYIRLLCALPAMMLLSSCSRSPLDQQFLSVTGEYGLPILIAFCMIAISILIPLQIDHFYKRRKLAEVRAFDNLRDDAGSIVPLLDYLNSGNLDISGRASKRLSMIVAQLPEPVHVHLGGHDRDELYHSLRHPDVHLVCALVLLIQKMEDTASLREMTELAQSHRDARVKAAALQCIESLSRKLDLSGETLLRPASLDDGSLLRAAGAGNASPREELLRVAEVVQPTE